MILPLITIIVGLFLLVWSADKFVDGTASVAENFGISPLIIGMLVIGFGTSAPEMVVSVIASYQGNPGIALGNAYGSNITNIALILGLTAVISPIAVKSHILKKELPLVSFFAVLSGILLWDLNLSQLDGVILLGFFFLFMGYTTLKEAKGNTDSYMQEINNTLGENHEKQPLGKAWFWLFTGLVTLIISSRLLVWGAVEIAHSFGVSDLVIGLTIIAIGTSLPELASSITAARKGENDIALGNILGSNIFNTLAVVGLAGVIHPLEIDPMVLKRDILYMVILTLSLFIFGFGFNKSGLGSITRLKGIGLLLAYGLYNAILFVSQ